MSLYLNFTDTHIVEEDFTKTIGFELKSCHKLKAIDLNYNFSRESVKTAITFQYMTRMLPLGQLEDRENFALHDQLLCIQVFRN